MNDFETLLGKGAASFYEAAGVSLRSWRMGTKGVLSYGSDEYLVVRHSSRRWQVCKDGEVWWFGSQWELLSWFGDRL